MKANSESATQGYSLLTLSGITDADAACEDEKEMKFPNGETYSTDYAFYLSQVHWCSSY